MSFDGNIDGIVDFFVSWVLLSYLIYLMMFLLPIQTASFSGSILLVCALLSGIFYKTIVCFGMNKIPSLSKDKTKLILYSGFVGCIATSVSWVMLSHKVLNHELVSMLTIIEVAPTGLLLGLLIRLKHYKNAPNKSLNSDSGR